MPELPKELASTRSSQLEKVRRGLIALFAERVDKYTIHDVREKAGTGLAAAQKIVRFYRAGKMPPLYVEWGDLAGGKVKAAIEDPTAGLSAEEVAERKQVFAKAVEDASSDEDRERLAHTLLVLASEGVYTHQEVNALKGLLQQATQSAKAKRSTVDDTRRQSMILCTDEGWRLVRLFEGIVDDERRKGILRTVMSEIQEDLRERPNVDLGGTPA